MVGRAKEPSTSEPPGAMGAKGETPSGTSVRAPPEVAQPLRSHVLGLLPAALDLVPSVVLLLTQGGNLEFANAAGRDALAAATWLRLDGGRVLASHPAATRLWRDAIYDVIASAAPSRDARAEPADVRYVRLRASDDSAPWIVSVRRGPDCEFGPRRQTTAILLANEPGLPTTLDTGDMRQLFGLTEPECRLAERIVNARGLNEMADVEGLSWHSARDHLHSVFAKMQVRSALELMRRVLNDLPVFRRKGVGERGSGSR